MVGTRKTPGSLITEAVDRDDNTIDNIDQLSRNSTPPYSNSIYGSPPKSSSTDLRTPSSTLIPSSHASPSKRPVTPPPALNLAVFRTFHTFGANEYILGISSISIRNFHDLYHDEEPGPLGIILLGQLGQFTTLKSAQNNFNKDKPEFSLQLQVEERAIKILKVLVRRRDRNLTVTNSLRIKVAEADVTSSSFTPGDPFPTAFDGTTTNDDQDGDDIDASRFTAGDKVAVQAWFGTYVFTNKSGKAVSGPTFRLLKLWRLQAGVAGSSSLNSSPVTKRRRIL
ncbi:hypothetical protein IFR05_016702 [Cadophora sp. M221]|nr:hypothetical protein IFR05_016702 [Cadophora sp. M221]